MKSWIGYLMVPLVLVPTFWGCTGQNAWTAYQDDIQNVVESKIEEQTAERSGREHWETYKSNDYQASRDFAEDHNRDEIERRRQAAAKQLEESGPLSLEMCLIHSLEFNDLIQASRASVRSVGGDELIAKSRFLPRLAYDLTASATENFGQNVAMGFTAVQTLLEFGKDNPIDVALRELQRQELFRHERVVAAVLSDVRLRFLSIKLRQGQLTERRRLRDEFATRYRRMVELEKKRRVVEADVLTAELNVLNEESRINALEKEIARQKMDLAKAMGFPVETPVFELTGQLEALGLDLKDSVYIAFRRSTVIAHSRAAVFEQDRVVRQIVWEYLPTVRAQGGYQGSSAGAGLDLDTVDNVYGVGPFAERYLDEQNDTSFIRDPRAVIDEGAGWYGSIDLTLPIFSGLERTGRFRRERDLLDVQRHLLSETIRDTELTVSKLFQTVLERSKQTDILKDTVRISKERLRIQERRKELGLIRDDELETFRERFFSDQDDYFEQQIRLVSAQEDLRLVMRYFETTDTPGAEQ